MELIPKRVLNKVPRLPVNHYKHLSIRTLIILNRHSGGLDSVVSILILTSSFFSLLYLFIFLNLILYSTHLSFLFLSLSLFFLFNSIPRSSLFRLYFSLLFSLTGHLSSSFSLPPHPLFLHITFFSVSLSFFSSILSHSFFPPFAFTPSVLLPHSIIFPFLYCCKRESVQLDRKLRIGCMREPE